NIVMDWFGPTVTGPAVVGAPVIVPVGPLYVSESLARIEFAGNRLSIEGPLVRKLGAGCPAFARVFENSVGLKRYMLATAVAASPPEFENEPSSCAFALNVTDEFELLVQVR